jgi:hypothetical protein
MANHSAEGVSNFDPATDIPSLAGRIILVTGGTGHVHPSIEH